MTHSETRPKVTPELLARFAVTHSETFGNPLNPRCKTCWKLWPCPTRKERDAKKEQA